MSKCCNTDFVSLGFGSLLAPKQSGFGGRGSVIWDRGRKQFVLDLDIGMVDIENFQRTVLGLKDCIFMSHSLLVLLWRQRRCWSKIERMLQSHGMAVGRLAYPGPRDPDSANNSPCHSHHAQKANAAGFCYVADIVLSLLKIKRAPGKPRIFYIDLDLHFSDGVSGPFANSFKSSKLSPQILTLSIHHAAPGFYPSNALSNLTKPDTSDLYTLSIPLKAGASSVTFRKLWESIERLKMAFDPEYTVVQCGVDGLAGDPMAKWNWTIDQAEEGSMGWCIQKILNWKCKTLLLGGGGHCIYSCRCTELSTGGYNSPNAARAWSYFTSLAVSITLNAEPYLSDQTN